MGHFSFSTLLIVLTGWCVTDAKSLFADDPVPARTVSRSDSPTARVSIRQVEAVHRLLRDGDYAEAGRVIERLREIAPDDPVLVLMRDQLLLLKSRRPEEKLLLSRTYPVADLLVPIPRFADLHLSARGGQISLPWANRTNLPRSGEATTGPQRPAFRPVSPTPNDFRPLVERLYRAIEPTSWDVHGGAGLIRIHPEKFSLVIYQTETAHAEIAELLENYRSRLDRQISISTRLIQTDKPIPSGPLTAEESEALLNAIQSDSRSNIVQAPKVTIFDGQVLRLRLDPSDWKTQTPPPPIFLRVGTVPAADRNRGSETEVSKPPISVTYGLDRLTGEEIMASVRSVAVTDGTTIMIDPIALRGSIGRVDRLSPLPPQPPNGDSRIRLLVTVRTVNATGAITESPNGEQGVPKAPPAIKLPATLPKGTTYESAPAPMTLPAKPTAEPTIPEPIEDPTASESTIEPPAVEPEPRHARGTVVEPISADSVPPLELPRERD